MRSHFKDISAFAIIEEFWGQIKESIAEEVESKRELQRNFSL